MSYFKKTKSITLVISVIATTIFVGCIAFAWTEPGDTPPDGNTDAPLTTSNDGQTKEGGLILNTLGAPNGLIVDKGNVGIGTVTPVATLEVNGSIFFEGGSGDVDGNGFADLTDYNMIGWYVNGTSTLTKEQYARADVDGDGKVTRDDFGMMYLVVFNSKTRDEAKQTIHGLYGAPNQDTLEIKTKNVNIITPSPATQAANLFVSGGIRLATGIAKPTCNSGTRGTMWFTQGATGVKDKLEVCAKDVANAYSWRTIY